MLSRMLRLLGSSPLHLPFLVTAKIHGRNFLTLVYTPGEFFRAHPWPRLTTPTIIALELDVHFHSGPPERCCQILYFCFSKIYRKIDRSSTLKVISRWIFPTISGSIWHLTWISLAWITSTIFNGIIFFSGTLGKSFEKYFPGFSPPWSIYSLFHMN